MSEKFHKSKWVPSEYRDLNRFKGMTLKEVIENLDASEGGGEIVREESKPEAQSEKEPVSIFDGFQELLRAKGIRVSVPEWLQFLTVLENKTTAEELKKLVINNELLNKIRLFAKTTLIKDKADEAAFHEAFDKYFELAAEIYSLDFRKEIKDVVMKSNDIQPEEERERDSGAVPEKKEELGIDEVDKKINVPEDEEHADDEQVHGGEKDQHADILKKEDLSKEGGGSNKDTKAGGEGDKGAPSEGKGDKGEAGEGEGDKGEAGKGMGDKGEPSGEGEGSSGEVHKEAQEFHGLTPSKAPSKEQSQLVEEGFLVGGGKGKSIIAQRVPSGDIVHEGKQMNKEDIKARKTSVSTADRRERHEVRPDRASMRQVIRNIRKIVLDVSEVKSRTVDLRSTVFNFARKDFRFDYQLEREKQPEIVLFIDVGGPVDEWSPLMKEITEEMTNGLSKLEVYLFHNNLYGYVWKPKPKDMLASSYAEPNSLIDVKKVVKKRKKVIIYGDAEMSYSEFERDGWPPRGNDDRVEKFGMGGDECLHFIKRKSDSVVWINPLFRREWEGRDGSGTIQAAGDIIPMYDLTVGGVEDAIKNLMEK